ncbi:hypothetical protein GUITHDRAFT_134255 [Guillardia theta CCMP2712]|uniref:Uncharacterized protein n=1 Tax=Guillardia theta (strain CCMP2712) TaxID=905079 RepID=L1JUF3_GUITC|nr:hypothetical protein GUITHDRAFT_134255 [Guillardia theta CCMP2712]EKX51939.1 hypothetical protein GUITHDRAFT_134255 [Guillardia theta CCMP2712]|eukprot:XP_005838919.1 hypothetical protein GUITHDRAFT_134255 [Guillardia theta CCMP2712]
MSPVLLLLLLLLIEVVPGERKSAMTSSAKIASERSPFSRLIMQLRGGRRSDHLPRSFKRALRRHTKSRLMEEKKKRGKGLDALIERLNATNKLPPPETEEVEAPRTWWWKPLMEDDPPDLSVLLDNDPPPPSQRPLGPDGKPVCANYDHLAKKMRNVEPVQEELWAACGCYAFDDPVDRTYSRIDIPEIVRCLKEGADVNMGHPLDRNNTPLHYLCRNGSVEAIETVIAHGANVSAINNGLMQWTPLHAAAYMGMVEAVQVLVKHGANVTCVDDDDQRLTANLNSASYGGHADVCKVLVELGCPVDIRFPEFSWSALHIAASRGFPDVCVTLMEVGAECSAIFKSKMREESIYDLECLETTIEGKKVLLVVSGQFAGNVYSHVSDPGKEVQEESQYLGRLRIEDHTIDPSIPEEQGCQQVDDDEEMPEPPDWAYHTDGTPWEYTMSLMEEIKVEGEKYLLEAGTAAVYQYRKPHRFLGLLRKDKTIDFGARMPGWGDTPFNVQEPMMPGRPSFVIGKLNGSIDAARQYNKKLHEGPWKVKSEDAALRLNHRTTQKMHEYGIFKLNVDGISSYPPECEEGQPCPSLEPSSRKKSSKKSSTDLMELDESDEVRKPRKIKGLGPKTPPAKSFEDQLADAMWEIRSKELQRSVRYEAVGEDVVGIRQDKHPLWRKTACK